MTPKQLAYDTADYIEKHPNLYDYWESGIPDCGSEGCVVGLMAMLLCASSFEEVSSMFGFDNELGIYNALDPVRGWMDGPEQATKALRAWADTLPAEVSENIVQMEKTYLELYPIQELAVA